MNKKYAGLDFPAWFDGKDVNEAAFCREFLSKNKLIYADNAFFTPDGRLTDPLLLKEKIYAELECCAAKNIPRTISNIVEIMKLAAHTESFPPKPDEIHVQNGTLRIDGSFLEGRPEIVRSRFPINYNPRAGKPVVWLRFLSDLLYPEDIPTFQEYIGYCLIPSTKGQRMMILKGEGGEGKSQISPVLARLFGCNMKDGSIAKISDNRFARADLEHIHLLVDDDMKMEALKQTNYVKSIVTVQGKMDLERKSVQSYQGWTYARLLAFSNGDLQSLYDRSNGFYRRQLILTTKEKPADRVDDPDIAEKMKLEVEGIFLWAFEGLQRLAANSFRFTESPRTLNNREYIKRDANNAIDFMESTGYIRLKADMSVTSKELYAIYGIWCDENGLTPIRQRSFSDFLMRNLKTYNLEHTNTVTNATGRRVWGVLGIEPLISPRISENWGKSLCTYVPKADAHPTVNKAAHAVKCCLPCTAGTYVHSEIPQFCYVQSAREMPKRHSIINPCEIHENFHCKPNTMHRPVIHQNVKPLHRDVVYPTVPHDLAQNDEANRVLLRIGHHRQKSERICGMAVFSLTSTPASPIRNHTTRNYGGKN